MGIQYSKPVRERANQKGATQRLRAIAGHTGPSVSALPMYHLCFHIIFTFPATVPLLFHPFLGHFNRNLLAKSPHVPPLFPKFFSHPPLPTSRPHRLLSIVHQLSPPFRALRAFSCLSRSRSGGPSGQLPPGYDIISAPQPARTCSRRDRPVTACAGSAIRRFCGYHALVTDQLGAMGLLTPEPRSGAFVGNR